MDFKEQAESQYKKLEKEMADISKETKRRKAEIDKEMKEKKYQLKLKLTGLEKYLIGEGVKKKKVRVKK